MATRNDFIYVKAKSKSMFKFIPKVDESNLNDTQKERLGFYHLILEKITGLQDANDIQQLIQDQEYVQMVKGELENDYGIDAVYINQDATPEKEIMLFNFKYRENFNADKTMDGNTVTDSMKFFQFLKETARTPKGMNKNSNTYKNIKAIKDTLKTDNYCNMTLYLVSNESKGMAHSSNELLKVFEDNYSMKIKTISLNEIMTFIDSKKNNIKAALSVHKSDLITYKVDEKSTAISYICKLSLLDLIRITCNDEIAREECTIETAVEKMLNSSLEYSLLYDNVRGYLGEPNYNKNILKTINNNCENFFMYNNGITITSSNIICNPFPMGEKYKIELKDFQVVNGGQTLRSVYNYFDNHKSLDNLECLIKSQVLLRLFKIESEQDTLKNNIAEYTNSQNAISPTDLKSVSKTQIDIERYLKQVNILYARKSGDVGDDSAVYELRISMEKFTQILYASQGFPERVSNVKKKLFSDYYDEIYNDNFKIEVSKKLIEDYFAIEKYYRDNSIDVYDQKIFYIIYLIYKYDITIASAHLNLSSALAAYQGNQKETRILLRKDFKIRLDKFISSKMSPET